MTKRRVNPVSVGTERRQREETMATAATTKSEQRRPFGNLSTPVLALGFLWTDMSLWSYILRWIESISTIVSS